MSHGPKIFNLSDSADEQWVVVFRHRGQIVPITPDRLRLLLDMEHGQLAQWAGDASPAAVPAPRVHADDDDKALPLAHTGATDGETLNHASLSTRLTKIYNYSEDKRRLRPVHTGILEEALTRFDWKIPPHTTERVPQLLGEMLAWKTLPPPLAQAVESFLKLYQERRQK